MKNHLKKITALFISMYFLCIYFTVNAIQPLDADTLHFHNELEFHDFLEFHGLKYYDIQPQTDFFDCTTSSTAALYTGAKNAYDYLHEELFDGYPFTILVDHYGTRKIINTLMPYLEDPDANVCSVNLSITNPSTGQVVIFYDEYNWIDENGRNIFNANKKIYFLWGYDSGTYVFPTDAVQDGTGYDFTFPEHIPGETMTLNFDTISIYTQIAYYADSDGDGFGDASVSVLAYPFAPPAGYTTDNTDCDDSNSNVYPGATEICNGVDDNCDGNIDDIAVFPAVTPSGTVTVCRGSNVLLETAYTPSYTYQWYRNGNILPGATGNTYSTNKSGNYSVQVSSTGGCSAVSEITTIAVQPKPNATITNLDGVTNLCIDPSIQLKANNGGGYTYQWYFNGSPIADATGLYFAAEAAGQYKVKVTNGSGCNRTSAPINIENVCRSIENTYAGDAVVSANIFPSPNDGNFTIQLLNSTAHSQEITIEMYAATGQCISSVLVTVEGEIRIPVAMQTLHSGIYFIRIQNGDNVQVMPVHIQK